MFLKSGAKFYINFELSKLFSLFLLFFGNFVKIIGSFEQILLILQLNIKHIQNEANIHCWSLCH